MCFRLKVDRWRLVGVVAKLGLVGRSGLLGCCFLVEESEEDEERRDQRRVLGGLPLANLSVGREVVSSGAWASSFDSLV